MTRTIIVFAAALTLAAPAAAQEGGEVVLTLDGEEVAFPLWESQSDWSGGAGPWASINIYARPTDPEAWERYKTFTLGFSGTENAGSPEASLSRMQGDALQRLHSDDEAGSLAVSLDGASVEGEFLTLSGTVSGAFGPSDNFGRDIDMSDPVPIEGRFSVTLGPVE